jgi:hypothetical protein
MVLKKGLDVRLLLANDDDGRLLFESIVCFDGICVSFTFNVLTFCVKLTKSSSDDNDETVSSPSLYS